MVNRMRSTRSHTGNRRSHHALHEGALILCPDCGAPKANHAVCLNCGKYNGKVIIDVVARAKRQARRDKKHQKELRAAGQEKDTTKQEAPAS